MPEVNIFVQNADGTPLMPTHHYGRVKRMLRSGKARIASRKPFVIRLTYQIQNPGLQKVIMGIDPERTNIGIAFIDDQGRDLGSYLIDTDNKDVPKNLKDKKTHRMASRHGERKRRQRRAIAQDRTGKLKITEIYRMIPGCKKPIRCKSIINTEARFNNRKHPKGWLTPTARHLLNTHLQAVRMFAKYYPVTEVAIEINRFDFAKMENPGIRNWEYQKGRLFGFANCSEAVSKDQNGRCLLCGRRKIEHYHHIVPRSQNGSESMDNIAGLCTKCHDLVHKDPIAAAKLKKKKHGLQKRYHALSVINQIMPALLKELSMMYPTYITTGRKTHHSRDDFGFPTKHNDDGTHNIDAWVIAVDVLGITPAAVPDLSHPKRIRQFRRHDRARIHYQHERSYYLQTKDGRKEKVAENRHKRTGQSDAKVGKKKVYPSLAEYVQMYPENAAKLTVQPSTRGYNVSNRVLPGALVKYQGKTLVISGKHNDRYQFAQKDICKEAPMSQCTVLCHNKGLVFI